MVGVVGRNHGLSVPNGALYQAKLNAEIAKKLARWTGLEPATCSVTSRRSTN